MNAVFFRFCAILLMVLFCAVSPARAQALPKCTISGVAPDEDGNMAFRIRGDQDFYVGNAQFVLHIGKTTFSLNQQEGPLLTFFIPVTDFNRLAEGEQIFLTYGDAHATEDEELLVDACRQKLVNTCSLGLFTRDLLRR